ncbi:hypothetical protein DH2020_021036 [Rehmannia glutinosa]|uniref:Zinc finger protein n=1 Tax=Rehmannia glutinosa TaxID=99300 RepID=A0ABR0W985_REHGL
MSNFLKFPLYYQQQPRKENEYNFYETIQCLPLLSRFKEEKEEIDYDGENEKIEENVTVALHIGLPDIGEINKNIDDHQQKKYYNFKEEKYVEKRFWIPTPAQILVGPMQFSCNICNKNFNRYNNMQGNTARRHAKAPLLLLRHGRKNNINHPRAKPLKDFLDPSDPLQAQARRQALRLPKIVRQVVRRQERGGPTRRIAASCGFSLVRVRFKHKRSLKDHIRSFGNGHSPHPSLEGFDDEKECVTTACSEDETT